MDTSTIGMIVAGSLGGLAGLVGGIVAWFTFARQLVTRDEVGTMIQGRISPLAERTDKLERVIEDIQRSLVELRVLAAKLTVLLETRGRADNPTNGA